MTSPSGGNRRFDDEEFALILRRAAELQERREGREARARGYSLAEIEQIAREAGIAPAHVRTVVAALTRSGPSFGLLASLAGGPYRFRYEHTLPTELPDADRGAIIDAARTELEAQGEARQVLDAIEWKETGDMGSVFVTVTNRDGETVVRAGADRDAAAGLLVGLTPILGAVGGMIATAALDLGPGIQAAALMGGGAAATYLGARFTWTRISAKWEKRLARLMTRLTTTAEDRLARVGENASSLTALEEPEYVELARRRDPSTSRR
jgi:hypothetical protein